MFELKFSLRRKGQYEACMGQVSDRIEEIFRQQPRRKHATALILGRESMEVVHFPSNLNANILRSGLLPLFGNETIAPGMAMLFRFFKTKSSEHLNYKQPVVPSNFKASCGRRENLQCLPRSLSESSSSVYKATLKAKDGGEKEVAVKFGKGVEHEVRCL